MNLDELKVKLVEELELNSSNHKSIEELQSLLHTKSSSIVQKIKKSLIFEIVFTLLFFIIFTFIYFFSSLKTISIYFGSFAILCIPFAFVLVYLWRKVNQYHSQAFNVKSNLTKLHALIAEFCKRYFQFTMAIIPIAFIFSISLITSDYDAEKFTSSTNNKLNSKGFLVGFIIGYVLITGLGVYKFTKWYIKKLYGNYLKELENLLEEL